MSNRSNQIKLAFIGGITFLLAACASQYKSPADCISDGHSVEVCEKVWKTASIEDQLSPPVYFDQQACAKDWPSHTCVQMPHDTHYRPEMAGMEVTWEKGDQYNFDTVKPLYFDGMLESRDSAYFLRHYGSESMATPPTLYHSVEDCEDDYNRTGYAKHTHEECVSAFNEAISEKSPSFNNQDTCSAAYERCKEGANGVWNPVTVGFIVGSHGEKTTFTRIFRNFSHDNVVISGYSNGGVVTTKPMNISESYSRSSKALDDIGGG